MQVCVGNGGGVKAVGMPKVGNSYGLYSYGPYNCGLCSYGQYSDGLCSYGLYSYGVCSHVVTVRNYMTAYAITVQASLWTN